MASALLLLVPVLVLSVLKLTAGIAARAAGAEGLVAALAAGAATTSLDAAGATATDIVRARVIGQGRDLSHYRASSSWLLVLDWLALLLSLDMR